jgi:enoyl-CoA hydratase
LASAIHVDIDGPVAEVIIDRPPVNAVTTAMYGDLIAAFEAVSRRTDVHCALLRSALPGGFSAGADIREAVAPEASLESPDQFRARLARTCYDRIVNCAQPTIAVVNGYALGAGAVLAASCDIRYMAASARIGLPEINAGRCGGGRHLMRLIPQGRLRLMYFTGEPMSAQEALHYDLVQAVLPDNQVLEQARALARRIAGKSPLGLRLAKRALNECESMELDEGYGHEQSYTLRLATTHDAAEAVAATLEKRAPRWQWGRGQATPGELEGSAAPVAGAISS